MERAHAPLRTAYDKLKIDLPDMKWEELLQMAVKAVNDAVGPSGVSPTMHVFGSAARHFPVLSRTAASTHASRREDLARAQRAVEKYKASESTKRALQHRGPFLNEDTALTNGEKVLAYRQGKGWNGSHQSVRLTNADADVKNLQTGHVTSLERSQIHPYYSPLFDENEILRDFRELVTGVRSPDEGEQGRVDNEADISFEDEHGRKEGDEETTPEEKGDVGEESAVFAVNSLLSRYV